MTVAYLTLLAASTLACAQAFDESVEFTYRLIKAMGRAK